jgi:NAD(P)-dependent dehydrogenase (short-subunit alcohol dehydrogenase family)
MTKELEGKVVLITGGTEGLGYAMAQAIAEAGASVVISARNGDKGASAEKALNDAVGREAVAFVQGDITKSADHDKMISFSVEKFGKLTGAINNAVWPGDFKVLVDEPEESFDLCMNTNIKGVWLGLRAQINQFAAQGAEQGDDYSIINISSGATRDIGMTMGPYVASKRAVEGLTESAAVEHSAMGIRTNTLLFGMFRTAKAEQLYKNMPGFEDMALAKHKVGRLGDPAKDAGPAAVFLQSHKSLFMTGSTMYLDGGMCL